MVATDEQMLAVPLEAVPVGVPIEYPIYVRINESWVLFRALGDTLLAARLEALKARSVNLVYVPEKSWDTYVSSLEKKCEIHQTQGFDNSLERVVKIRSLLLAYSQEIENKRRFQRGHCKKFEHLANRLAAAIYQSPDIGKQLLRRYGDSGLYFVNHSLNVAIYSAEISKKLGLSLNVAKKLTCGALLHNTGNLFLPKSILYKPGALSDEEWSLIYSHPRRGAELLGELNAPAEAVLIALQHHERIDGKGYPSQSGIREIHLLARVCSIADVFDALTNNAPYQQALASGEAVEKMLAMRGKFDPDILRTMSAVG